MLAARAAWHSASNPEFASVLGAIHPHLTIHLTGGVHNCHGAVFMENLQSADGSPEGHQ